LVTVNESQEDKLERIFGAWLRWSRDAEVLQLLTLVVGHLQRRGFRVAVTVEPPARKSTDQSDAK